MKDLKIVIFDLDGTLVNAYKAVSRSLNYALKECDLPTLDDYTVQRSVGWGEKKLVYSLVAQPHADKVLSLYRKHHAKALIGGVKFLPGAKKVLTHLHKRKYKLAIASNRPTRFTNIILKHLNIHSLFHYVLCGDKVKNPKPAKDMLVKILEKFSLHPKEALYVGDMTIDVETGHKAKVKTVAVVTGSSTKAEIAALKPHKIIHRIDDLFEVVLSEKKSKNH